jgi:hypothetical protein
MVCRWGEDAARLYPAMLACARMQRNLSAMR